MKQRLMPLYDKIMLRKEGVIESINDVLKNVAQLVHSRHRSVHNFIMNLLAAMGAYCFFATKPGVNFDYDVLESSGQLVFGGKHDGKNQATRPGHLIIYVSFQNSR